MANLETTVGIAVSTLGLVLVEVERASNGLLRVFIDRPEGKGSVTVEDCSTVSNHLSHLFTVENVDYERLEVSSPGLDRVLKTAADFVRYQGQPVKVRLNTQVDARKRFSALVQSVQGNKVLFAIMDESDLPKSGGTVQKKRSNAKTKAVSAVAVEKKMISVELGQIEKARLIPQL
ncbi:MAG: ribosome maturation factor RimP [Pseudomonadota bacterium]